MCSPAGEVLVALDGILSNSGKPFFTRAVWRGGFSLTPPQLLPKQKANPSFRSGLQIQLIVVFSGCGVKIPQIIGVSGIECGPVSGTEPSSQLKVQL